MNRWITIFLTLLLFQLTNAQIVTTDPVISVASDMVTVYFDATLGTAELMDYEGEVYAHTGVLTESSSGGSDWKYVKTEWGTNTDETKMTRVSSNLYSIEITPSVREYYGVPPEEKITHLAFVFRSSDNSREGKDDGGKDIFVPLFEEGLTISIVEPGKNTIIDPVTDLTFEAVSSDMVDIDLYINGFLVKTATTTTITHNFNIETPGDYWLMVIASSTEGSVADSVFVHVLDAQKLLTLPGGLNNGVNYISNQAVQLVLHAPGKEHVFVVGDFNNWTPSTDARMNLDDERWWITVSGLEPGVEYAYQYLVDGELKIADPYTEKVLDPHNDQWISDETYPGLKPYPAAFTSGNTAVLQTAQQPYPWKNSDFIPPAKEKLVIYELLVRDFIAKHNWKTLTDTLNYFTELGINAIELMPFNEFEGNESWGYNPSFYFAPDKYYGPKDDLQAFIDSCHGRGIAVIMDMTLNHSFSQSPLVQLYFDGSTVKVTADNPWYNVNSPNQVFSWGYDFNHESPATQDFVDRVNSHWLTEYDLDGFRFDFTKGFTNTPGDGGAYDASRITILKRMTDELRTVNPDAYVIFEHLADNAEEKALSDYGIMLWGNINYNYNEATMGWHDSGKSDFSWISYKKRGWNDPHLVGYMESHDEERLMFKNLAYGNSAGNYNIQSLSTALARLELAGVFFFTIPGPKMIWQFGELGYDFSIDYNGRVGNKPIRWDYFDVGKRQKVYQVWSALINLKKSEPAFSTTDFTLFVAGATKRIELNHPDMDIRIIGNFDVTEKQVDPAFSFTGIWYDYFAGDSLDVEDTHGLITLAPGEYRIYTTKRLSTPEITVEIAQKHTIAGELKIYPVPADNRLFVHAEQNIGQITLFDLNGRLISDFRGGTGKITLDVSGLTPGLYILRATHDNGDISRARFIKR